MRVLVLFACAPGGTIQIVSASWQVHDMHGFITLHDLHEMHDVHALHDTPKAAIMQNMHALKTMQTMHFIQQAEVERPGFAYLALLFSGGANIPAADVSH